MNEEYHIGDVVEIIEDDNESEETFVGMQGKIVEARNANLYGIDFEVEVECDTWQLEDDLLPKMTGRYYEPKCFKLVRGQYCVNLL